jgi:hypothetical protein
LATEFGPAEKRTDGATGWQAQEDAVSSEQEEQTASLPLLPEAVSL